MWRVLLAIATFGSFAGGEYLQRKNSARPSDELVAITRMETKLNNLDARVTVLEGA
jgi:hypothetical protein